MATLDDIVHRQPEPVTQFNRAVPPALRRVLDRTLAKDPEARYDSVRDSEAALRRVRDELAGLTARRMTRRRMLGLGGAAAAATAAGVVTWELRPPKTLAVLPFVKRPPMTRSSTSPSASPRV